MRVGAVAETITVTGETPVVDTQSARRQAVLSNDIINTLPATRTYGALLAAIPGLQVQGNSSAVTTPFMAMFTANGGRANEGRMMIDGLPVAASFNGGGVSTFIYDTANSRRDAGHGVGRSRRSGKRRASGEPRAEIGRQHVQGLVLRQRRGQVVHGQQPQRHAA